MREASGTRPDGYTVHWDAARTLLCWAVTGDGNCGGVSLAHV